MSSLQKHQDRYISKFVSQKSPVVKNTFTRKRPKKIVSGINSSLQHKIEIEVQISKSKWIHLQNTTRNIQPLGLVRITLKSPKLDCSISLPFTEL